MLHMLVLLSIAKHIITRYVVYCATVWSASLVWYVYSGMCSIKAEWHSTHWVDSLLDVMGCQLLVCPIMHLWILAQSICLWFVCKPQWTMWCLSYQKQTNLHSWRHFHIVIVNLLTGRQFFRQMFFCRLPELTCLTFTLLAILSL